MLNTETFVIMIIFYLLGSISFAVISSKIFSIPDPRSFGSKNPGATNILRSGNKYAAFFTLIGDSLKGFIPVLYILNQNFNMNELYLLLSIINKLNELIENKI